MRRWLVTGGLGFIGSNFIRVVLTERHDVRIINFDAMTYAGNPENCRDISADPRYSFVKGDICDREAIENVIGPGVDAIVNFAAETHVDRSILEPEVFLRTNLLGVQVLLEATRKLRVGRLVQISTDEVYGSVPRGMSAETDALRPSSPYSASKASGDLLVLAYYATYGTPALITRGSNTYGPYQYPEKMIPLFVTNLIDDRPVPLYGNGSQIRDWLHVEDHARGALCVLENGELGNVYNLGGGNERSNLEIASYLLNACGRSRATHLRHVADRKGHDRRYAVSSEKIRSLGWKPQVLLEDGISATVEWYRNNGPWWRPLKSGQFLEYYYRQYAHR